MNPDKPRVALVIGAGDATGGAIARRFARAGLATCVTRRSADKLEPLLAQIRAEGGIAHGFASDARKEDEVVALVDRIESTIGEIAVLVFNIGANAPSSILQETARSIRRSSATIFRSAMRSRTVTAYCVLTTSQTNTGCCTSSRAMPGPTNST